MIYKSIYFWILTAVVLIIVGFSGLKIIPPLLASIQENRVRVTELEGELAKQKKFLAAVNAIKQDPGELDSIFAKAELALPRKPDSAVLMLQLDGLLNSLGLGAARLDVPLGSTATSDETTEGTPPAASQNEITVTISGEFGYESFVALLDSLRTFGRWNKVESFELTRSGAVFTAKVATKAFVKPGPITEFSGNSSILEEAQAVFAGLQSYASKPDVSQEGSYGKQNPFAP